MNASAKKWMGVTLLATLVIGVGAGILLDRFLLASTVHSRARDADHRGRNHDDHARRMVERLRSSLELTDEQAERLESVIAENHETARKFWRESRKEFDTLRQQFRADIREHLTEEQKVKFDAVVAEYESRREQRRE